MTKPKHLRFVALLAAIFALAGTATVMAASTGPTKGPIPDAAWGYAGSLNLTLVPDYIPASDRAGNEIGYVSRDALIDPSGGQRDQAGRPVTAVWPVFAADLKMVVGHMVPNKGFVRVGADPASAPSVSVSFAPAP